jgi:hypothetical protein
LYRQFLGRSKIAKPLMDAVDGRLPIVSRNAFGIAVRKLADDWAGARIFTRRNLPGSLILHVAPRRDLRRFGSDDARL